MLRQAKDIVGVPWPDLVSAIWRPAAAASVMAVTVALADSFVESASRGTALGLALLGLEVVVGGAVYLLLMLLIARDMLFEALHAIRHVRGEPATLMASVDGRGTPLDSDQEPEQPAAVP